MSDYLTDRINRRIEHLQREIDEAKRKAKPHTPESFEHGDHRKCGQVLAPTYHAKRTENTRHAYETHVQQHGVPDRFEEAQTSFKSVDQAPVMYAGFFDPEVDRQPPPVIPRRFDPPSFDGTGCANQARNAPSIFTPAYGAANYGTRLDGLSPLAQSYIELLENERKRLENNQSGASR